MDSLSEWRMETEIESFLGYADIVSVRFVQHRQCRYNVILRRVLATIVEVEKQLVLQIVSVCVCNLIYPACNAHASYCHLWPVPFYNIFSHYLINVTISETGIEHKMYVLIFSAAFV
jgi:hypothetical protein